MEVTESRCIEIIRTELVRSGMTDADTLALGPLDWINACDYPAQIFLYENRLDARQLKRSLQQLLLDFPAFSGRCVVAADGIPSIVLNDAGLRFTEQNSALTLTEFLHECRSSTEAGEYTDKIAAFKSAASDSPLLAIRLTHLASGGSVLGVTHFHGVCDGGGMFQFFAAWSKVAKGEIYRAPVFDRSLLQNLQQSFNGTSPSQHDSFPGISLLELMQLFTRVKNLAEHSKRQVIHFSAADLAGIKRRALLHGKRPTRWFSSQDLLVAHLWREICLIPAECDSMRLSYILDLRKRHGFELPEEYIGNAHSIRSGFLTKSMLAQTDVVELAQRVREISDSADPISVGQDMAYLTQRIPGSNKLHITESALYPTETLTVNNLSNLPCYDLDLGVGNPIWYVPPEYPGCRIVHIVPSAQRDGGFDVHVKLGGDEMGRLRERHEAALACP
ncbi:acyltransferase [Tahibacter sp.]|uniref:acyltransferase n=1 Tax=Tahibacter sp. TaxID=2056211 RepID=UPI0028C4EFF2|nr:acyltransferase [Tahibacter sp.]